MKKSCSYIDPKDPVSSDDGPSSGGSSSSGSSSADIVDSGKCGDNLTWTLDEDGVLTISGTGKMYNTAFGEEPWYNVNAVNILDGVTSIGDYAFWRWANLTSIVIPDSVTSIGRSVSVFCDSLTSIIVDDGNQHYSSKDGVLFNKKKTELIIYPCDKSGAYTIPNSVISISDEAFLSCCYLTSISIPNSVTSIGGWAFYACDSLSDVYYEGSKAEWNAIEIGDENDDLLNATIHFADDSSSGGSSSTGIVDSGECGDNLTWTLDEDGVLTISGEGAMADYDYDNEAPWCDYRYDITSIFVNDGVTHIGDYAFDERYRLTSITLPDSVISIGDGAMYYCNDLTSITIPDSVTSIGRYAFAECHRLTSITIPDSVTFIGDFAFHFNYNISSIYVDENNKNYSSKDGILFDKTQTELILCPEDTSLTTYTIPDSVTSIGEYAFVNCHSLTSITIPDSVTSIGEYAFASSGITSITIPDSVTFIGEKALGNIPQLSSIYVDENNKNYSSKDGILFDKKQTELILCPEGKILTTYTIPNSVTSIGRYAFAHCDTLTSVFIPDSVTYMGTNVFAACASFTDIYYSGSEADWNAIEIVNLGVDPYEITIHYNS